MIYNLDLVEKTAIMVWTQKRFSVPKRIFDFYFPGNKLQLHKNLG